MAKTTVLLAGLAICAGGCVASRDDKPMFVQTYPVPAVSLGDCTYKAMIDANYYANEPDLKYTPIASQGMATLQFNISYKVVFLVDFTTVEGGARVTIWEENYAKDIVGDLTSRFINPCAAKLSRAS